MRNIFISMIILVYMPSVLFAQNLLKNESYVYSSGYFKEVEVSKGSLASIENLSIDVKALENEDFEVKFSANKYFKPFIIVGAKISEFLSSFNLSNLSKGMGANIYVSESLSCYAKYSSNTIENARLSAIDSSVMYVGLEYNF